jgi:hypothetical protein
MWACESLCKLLLCAYLMFRSVRLHLSIKVALLPYTIGYVSQVLLGHATPLQDPDRAGGFNVELAILSELTRFIGCVLMISLSFKVMGKSTSYRWLEAFWPCWGLEGLLLLAVVVLIPLCVVSAFTQRARLLMLTWAALTTLGLAITNFLSIVNLVEILDFHLCTDCCQTQTARSKDCLHKLQLVFWPWLVFLLSFGIGTLLLRRKLVPALHNECYRPTRRPALAVGAGIGSGLGGPASDTNPEELPIPQVLFRITNTYYSRAVDSVMLGLVEGRETRSSTGPRDMMLPENTSHRYQIQLRSWPSFQGRTPQIQQCSWPSLQSRMPCDPSATVLSARGSTFADIVESEQLCFVCYDRNPEVVLLECGHAGLCVVCALQIMDMHCPVCREAVARVMRLCTDHPLPAGLFTPSSAGSASIAERFPDDGGGVGMLDAPSASWPPQAAPLLTSSVGAPATMTRGVASEVDSSVVQGPPWPAAAKRHAVVVQIVERQRPQEERWWWRRAGPQ